MSLLKMSISGAVMILVIVVLRALAIHKLPKRAFLALWGVAAARLLIPYSLPSALSVYSLLGRFRFSAEAAETAPAVRFAPVVPARTAAATPAGPAVSAAAAPADPWALVWLAGALACAAFFALAYLKCRREFRSSLPVDNEYVRRWLDKHRIRRAIEIRQSDRISAPLTYGVFRPVILMPKTADWEDGKTLDYVLAHEYVHIRRFDAAAKLVLTAALCVHWFDPAVWLMYVLANRDVELSCDEAVIRRFGKGTRSAYAMALIRMEEARNGFTTTPLCNNFSKNAIEERITAIMKIKKKTSLAALFAAVLLVAVVTTAFATSAKPEDDPAIEAVTEMTTTVTLVNAEDGTVYLSYDGGNTYEAMTAEEYATHFPTPEVEWWTYEEYEAWLENEKAELQSLIGERAWTGGRGDFVWTQEIVDEAVAMYEEILEDIKNGMLYSKTVNGDADGIVLSMVPENIAINIQEDPASAADFAEYAPYGLVWDEGEKALFRNGQRVRYFLDGVDLDGTGAMAILLEYADAELRGEIDVHTVRERVQNADGSYDPMGPLTGLERYSQAEFDARSFLPPAREAVTSVLPEIGRETAETGMSFANRFDTYAPFGITYEEAKGASGAGNVYLNGRLVSRFADVTPDGDAFSFTSAKQGGITVRTVYDGGVLTGVETVTD